MRPTGRLLLAGILLLGCTARDPDYCAKEADCTGGRVCDLVRATCVWTDAAVAISDSGVDSPDEIDAAPDVPLASDVEAPADGLISEDLGNADGPSDAGAVDGPGPDVAAVDAAGTCAVDDDCTDPTQAFCVAGACTGCQNAAAGICGLRTCDQISGKCVECVTDGQCTTDPAKGFCVANACVGCDANGATGCAARTDGRTVCAATGVCAECSADSQCSKDPAHGFCVANACVGCQSAPTDACGARSAAKPLCGATGLCVECNTSADCTGATKPICALNTCAACATDLQCAAKLGANPGVCMSNIDGHCAVDAETVYVGSNATATCNEGNPGTAQAPVCSAANGVGIAKSKSKSLIVVTGASTAGSTTIAISEPLTIVGKNNALLAPAFASSNAIDLSSGELYLRGLAIEGGTATGIGINATPGSGSTVTLHMDNCAVLNNPGGGILLNGAAFDIENTTVTGNGPGTFNGLTTWGGILVNNPPASGPDTLNQVTIKNNQQVGLSCSASVTGTGVFATGNVGGVDINPTCGVPPCSPDAGCGAE